VLNANTQIPIVSDEPTFPSKLWARAIRDDESISPHAKTLAAWLANLADGYGRVNATVNQLRLLVVNDAGQPVGAATIKRRRKELTDGRWLTLIKQGGKGRGRDFASVYQLVRPDAKTAHAKDQKTAHGSAKKRLTPEPHSVTHSVLSPDGERQQADEGSALKAPAQPTELESFPIAPKRRGAVENAAPPANGAAYYDVEVAPVRRTLCPVVDRGARKITLEPHGAIPSELDIRCRAMSSAALAELREQPAALVGVALYDAARQERVERQALNDAPFVRFRRALGGAS
jgi:hypothetical protein